MQDQLCLREYRLLDEKYSFGEMLTTPVQVFYQQFYYNLFLGTSAGCTMCKWTWEFRVMKTGLG